MVEICYSECHYCFKSIMPSVENKLIMLRVVMLNIVMLNVVMLNVVMLSVVVPA
jgi:hypothetical protein